ncbi:aldo/keto reductase [Paenibacillus sp. JX-17]|uniref:Aldo/keto reductase n=1 Tax=Paenibacillus lacisoli TaxID=3064525 RepID=A0ABT9CFZ5_9BACL|nr:aldo/keto reductase [Paenibacillus sp. JX-17]MDO7908196.1 aldo/keto reductase [Paenibacillus sp. JX-17]
MTIQSHHKDALHPDIPSLVLHDGTELPRLGQGTWHIGDNPDQRQEEIETLRLGVELGMRVIDTAEMYGEGRSEELVGEAIRGIRDQVFLVSKVYPHNAGLNRIAKSCEASLKRLGTDHLDLYLLHWMGNIPLEETVEGMERLVTEGKIRRWGVSNLDTSEMKKLTSLERGGHCAVNQVLYHLGSRGIEYDLLPWQRANGMPVMAYCPIAQAGSLRSELVHDPSVKAVAERHGITPYQLLLAWCIRHPDVMAIPKTSSPEHVRDNAAAARVQLTEEDLNLLDQAFPAPGHKVPLDIV